MGFEWSFRAGDILYVIGSLAIAASFFHRRGGDEISVKLTLEALTQELSEMKTEFKAFGETLKKVAIQEMQIGLLMKWYDELRRGDGYVTGRKNIDGEYP